MVKVIEARVISNFPNLVVNAGFGRIFSFNTDNHYDKSSKIKLLIHDCGQAELFDIEHDASISEQKEAIPSTRLPHTDLDCIE